MSKQAIIIGAGINGLCVAEALHARGYRVRVFDKAMIPNLNAASALEAQIVRPQYVENERLGLRILPALEAWRELFKKLGTNYFKPTGVVAGTVQETGYQLFQTHS